MRILAIVELKEGGEATLTKSGWTVKPANPALQHILNLLQPDPGRYFPTPAFGRAMAVQEEGFGQVTFIEDYPNEKGVVY